MKSQVLHTVWCNMTGEATGEIWTWSLVGVKGLTDYQWPPQRVFQWDGSWMLLLSPRHIIFTGKKGSEAVGENNQKTSSGSGGNKGNTAGGHSNHQSQANKGGGSPTDPSNGKPAGSGGNGGNKNPPKPNEENHGSNAGEEGGGKQEQGGTHPEESHAVKGWLARYVRRCARVLRCNLGLVTEYCLDVATFITRTSFHWHRGNTWVRERRFSHVKKIARPIISWERQLFTVVHENAKVSVCLW